MSNMTLSPAAQALGLGNALTKQLAEQELERKKKKARDQGLYSTAAGQLLGGMGASGGSY